VGVGEVVAVARPQGRGNMEAGRRGYTVTATSTRPIAAAAAAAAEEASSCSAWLCVARRPKSCAGANCDRAHG